MKLWSDKFKPHAPFLIVRREYIQKKWDDRKARRRIMREGMTADAVLKGESMGIALRLSC